MRVLGIDPGTLCTGYGIIESLGNQYQFIHFGIVKNTQKSLLSDRLANIYQQLNDVIEEYQPDVASIEEIFFCKNVNSAVKLGEARGVAILVAKNNQLPVVEYSAKQIKKAVTGNGNAKKEQVAHMVKRLLKLDEVPKSMDATDALAMAICHFHSYRNQLSSTNKV